MAGITTFPAMDAIWQFDAPAFVVARNERCASHMAEAAARLAAKLGVLLVGLGSGLANTLTAALAAMRDSSSLLIIAGAIANVETILSHPVSIANVAPLPLLLDSNSGLVGD
ncbi:hypothetical protein J0X12_10280 [Sneathiella sp. CAU 1612]|uniref:Thiamine pyrophosphate enzyme N-terminal TPP-binding domain-containing protein n=1 Tax=Sneathiella sedimenti TaxID=2816034 RepID=A0ABS3F654_9PROT|nr:hypothetical protein [Sneathiella sedimenti]